MTDAQLDEEQSAAAPQHGQLYWFARHLTETVKGFSSRHKTGVIVGAVVAVLLLFGLRAFYHPIILSLRKNIWVLTIGVPLALVLWFVWKRFSWKVRVIVFGIAGVAVVSNFLFDIRVHEYLTLYFRYRSLQIHDLKELPLTTHDRIQPFNSIVSLANEAMVETETPATPHLVRIGDELRWTIGIEPAYMVRRLMGGVRQVFNVSGTASSIKFSKEKRNQVSFETGENLMLWHNTGLNVVRAFGILRYLNYEPCDVIYVQESKGNWLQVVPLIRWRGLFFPRPEFGGVQLVRQAESHSFFAGMKRMICGVGEWVRPEDVAKYPFLQGQDILPRKVSRYIASSFRFQSGFLAPFPGYHLGDIRIPDLPSDVYDQPFTIRLAFSKGEAASVLYHYFGLEPYHHEKQGLNTSVFIPADGSAHVYVYRHHTRSEALTGVSAIGPKVMESRKQYDWNRNRPVEHRPYIKTIAGQTRFFWLTTVVTLKDPQPGSEARTFFAGTTPDVCLTDAAYKVVVWVNPLAPELWDQQVEKELAGIWKH